MGLPRLIYFSRNLGGPAWFNTINSPQAVSKFLRASIKTWLFGQETHLIQPLKVPPLLGLKVRRELVGNALKGNQKS